jgi:hypothetical protein
MSIWEDGDGRLWSIVRVAARTWQRGVGKATVGEGGRIIYPLGAPQALYESIIEVFDTRTGQLLTSKRVPAALSYFVDDRTLVGFVETGDGVPRLEVWSYSFTREAKHD